VRDSTQRNFQLLEKLVANLWLFKQEKISENGNSDMAQKELIEDHRAQLV
jgi:hypothetical protein